jgi:hypothetical protein
MMKALSVLLALVVSLTSFANEKIKNENSNPSEDNKSSTHSHKSLFEKLVEKGIGESVDSADGQRTGGTGGDGTGNGRCNKLEK